MSAQRKRLPKGVVSLAGFRRRRARDAAAAKRHEEELKQLAEDAKLYDEVAGMVDLSVSLLERGNLRGAEYALRTALSIDSTNTTALFNLGCVFEQAAREYDAVTCYEEVLGLDPDFADAHFNLGRILKTSTSADLRQQAQHHLTAYEKLIRRN